MIRTCPLFVCFCFFINLPCILREEGAAYGTRLEVVGVHSLPEHWYYVSAPVYGSLSRSPSPISDVVEYSAARGGHGQIAPARISGKTEKSPHAPQISASCIKRPGVSAVGARLLYLPDSVSKGLSASESPLKSKGSASCSSSMQSLSVRFPDREYFASAAASEIKSLVNNGY